MPFLGQALIQRVLQRVRHLGDETMIITNHPAGYRFLGLPLVSDVIPGRGALGGLYTALKVAHTPLVAVVACDLPFVNADILSLAVDRLEQMCADAVIPRTERGLEPLHAVYRREPCLPAVKAAIEADKWRMISWHAAVDVQHLSPQEIRKHDPRGLTFKNVNTPDAFRQAEEIARKLESSAS